ncbi:TMEM165/GDT1 family protein [Halomarina salina]|uniref:TMEM165/GDT1 family protein n=1 Tax=Halomarina salina TaxID=1872699 RepID=A0ABD5RQ59_9EURY|nr:TMEM165/GDT1 family protein [Halomarina salina]
MTTTVALAQSSGLQSLIREYADYGPLLASFLVNMLGTFGDKGQLVVVTLASRYDAKRVFLGAMGAFCAWSALEVAFGQALLGAIPAGVMGPLTGALFVLFGAWTARSAFDRVRVDRSTNPSRTDGGIASGLSGRVLPDPVLARVGTYGGLLASFVLVGVAEFGDKTQLLTINLAVTFPNAPLSVFVGVVSALALRTGVDAVIGEHVEAYLPTAAIEAGAAVVFVAFGLFVFGVLPELGLVVVLLAVLVGVVGWGVRARRD